MKPMRLIGMLDSPYVRRVAISLRLQNIPFDYHSLSVFSTFDAFAAINPVVKAPTLVVGDSVLMDSTLMLELAERMAAPDLKLTPADLASHIRAQTIIGTALAACEKTVQIVYEHNLRPPEKQHQPWIDRVRGQMLVAFRLLEEQVAGADPWLFTDRPLQADVTSAVVMRFARFMLPDLIDPTAYPALAALSARAEATETFRAFDFT